MDENEPSEEVSERPIIDLMLTAILPVNMTSMLVMGTAKISPLAHKIFGKNNSVENFL